jgi:hypothetical protein
MFLPAGIALGTVGGAAAANSAKPIDLPGVASIEIAIQNGMSIQKLPSNIVPQLSGETKSMFWGGSCPIGEPGMSSTAKPCIYGDLNAITSVVVYGDSFSVEWIPVFNALGVRYHFKVLLYARDGCPFADVKFNDWRGSIDSGCLPFRQNVVATINAMDPAPSLVILSEETKDTSPDGVLLPTVQWTNGVKKTIMQLNQAKFPVDVIFGEPSATSPPSACLSRFPTSITKCSSQSSVALGYHEFQQTASAISSVHAGLINTSSLFCFDETCPDVISNTLVHSDSWHIDESYAVLATKGLTSLTGCTLYQLHSLTPSSRHLLGQLLTGTDQRSVKKACSQSVTANGI